MPDPIDQSDEQNAPLADAQLHAARKRLAADNIPYIEGDCEVCGNPMPRLVQVNHPKDGVCWGCTRCRDAYKLPLA